MVSQDVIFRSLDVDDRGARTGVALDRLLEDSVVVRHGDEGRELHERHHRIGSTSQDADQRRQGHSHHQVRFSPLTGSNTCTCSGRAAIVNVEPAAIVRSDGSSTATKLWNRSNSTRSSTSLRTTSIAGSIVYP